MRSKRTQESSSIRTGKSAPNGREGRDQTTLLSAENARREAERKYQDIFENAVEGIFQTRPDGGFITANPALARMLGFESPEELIRARAHATGGTYYVHPERRVELKRLLDQHDTVRGFEFEAYRKDGAKIWMSDNVRAVRDVSGKLLYYEGTVEDITERKRAEAALQESEERFRQLSEAAFEAIILHDQGTILEVNQSFCRMYGYERAEVIGKSILDLALPEFRELLLQKVRAGDTGSYEGPALRKDGTTFRAELAGKPIHYQGRTVRVAAIRDVTEQERNERRQAAQYAVTRVLAESATLAEAIPKLLQAICESLRWNMGEFWRVCDSTNVLRCVETWHVPGLDAASVIEPSRQTELAPGVGLLGRVWQSGQPAWIPDVATDPTFRRAAIAAKVGLHAALAFPIFLGSQTLGVMLFLSRRVRDVDEDLLKTMSAIGSQIGQFTERKRAEDALKRSESDYRHLFNNANDAILIFESEGEIILEANAAACDIYGYSRDELIGTSLKRLTKSVPAGESQIKELLDAGTFSNYESIHFNNKGEEIYFLINSSVIDYQDRQVILSINHNITERKRAEEALRESEERYRDLVENSRELICTHDLDGRVLSANRAAAETLGYDSNELLEGKNIRDILTPEVSHQFDEYMARLRKEGTSSGIMLVQTRSGERRVWDYYNSLRTEGVAAPIVRGMARDITDRREAENALRVSEQKYRDIFRFAPVGICQTLRDGTLITANKALATMLGYDSVDELLKLQLDRDIYFLAGEREKVITTYENRGYALDLELQWKRKDGSPFWIQLNAHTIPSHDGAREYYEGFVLDITERKRAEEALLASERKYRDIFALAPVGIYQSLRDGTIITVNHTLAEMLDYASMDELLRVKLGRDVYLVDGERERLIREHEARGYPVDLELQWKTKHGSPIWIQLTAHAIKGANGATEYWEGFVRDITERKLIEEALRESEERYRDLVENIQDLVCTHDLEGRVLSANRALEKLLGYNLKDFGEKTFREILAPEARDRFDDYLVRIRRDGVASGLMLVQTSTGERRIWEYHNTLRTEGVATPIVRSMARDITERRRAEKVMSDLRRELELTMNSMEEGVHRVDMHGNIAFENPAAARMLGWEVAELLGKPAHLTMHHTKPDGTPYPKEKCPIYATIRDGVSRHGADEVFWRQDGTSFPVEYMTAPMRNDRNEIVATVVTFQDITERKRAEDTLRESEERYRSLFVNMLNGFAYCKMLFDHEQAQDFIYLEVNDAFEKLTGFKDVVGKKVTEIIPGIREADPELFETYGRVALTGKPETFEIYLASLGTWHSVSLYSPRKGYFVAVFDVITERKRTEAALRESEERYRELFENAKDAIYVHDLSGRYVSVNRAAERLTGYSCAEILGKHFWDFVATDDKKQVRKNLCKKLKETGETNYEVEIINREGARVPVEVSSRLIYENGVTVGVQGSVRDITERKRARQALLTYSRRLIAAQESERGRIARELHDQVGQMLTALKLNLHAIQSARDEGEVSLLIEDNLKMLDGALEQVRDLSVGLRPPLLDDLGLVTALHWFVDHQAQRTGVRAEFISDSVDSDLRFSTELETACFRIAQEALTNVARHARAKTVTIRLSRKRDHLILLIEDDGVGFEMEALQGHALASATLGLRGMQERAHAVGGRVKIDSATHKGTQVFVELPIALPNDRKPQLQNE
jgi:PAS domain S-box-containing protein